MVVFAVVLGGLLESAVTACAGTVPVLKGATDRPLRYRPEAGGFVIDNGPDSFNRPLYGGPTAFRVDAGDKPEFSLYLPGRGGVLRVGLKFGDKAIWLRDAEHVQARYADGAMSYVVTDPAFPGVTLKLTAVALRDVEGLAVRVDTEGLPGPGELLFAYGGASGEKHKRNGDIGTDSVPMSDYFALRPEHCKDQHFRFDRSTFDLRREGTTWVHGAVTGDATIAEVDPRQWASPDALHATAGHPPTSVALLATVALKPGRAEYVGLQNLSALAGKRVDALMPETLSAEKLERVFARAREQNRAVARQISVDTPDAVINSAVPALCLAADAIKDTSGTVMHGGVAWRMPLLGWRGPYAFDAIGDHAYARSHLDAYLKKQSDKPPVATQPAADEAEGLARSEKQLRTDGDLTDSHYDMNLVAVDQFFRGLLWTGDLDYAKKQWPVIKKHFEWEKRLSRRPFGPEGLPLYEAYACIWASDDLQYGGGGVAHASAYNYYHNTMAARVAMLIGEDPRPFADEAALIKRAMQQYLWMPDKGWFAESKDLLGDQLVHPAAGLWTHYHTIDSQVADARQAWQMCRYVDTQIPHIPVAGPGVPNGLYTLASTTWMPYTWSINNVAMAEVTHTALAGWQAGQPEAAFAIFKGALVDSMCLGQCPGNLQMTSFFDAYRQEAQRDSGDPIGITWRAMIEGLFGIRPDALAGELTIKPGFPANWDRASIRHPDVTLVFDRSSDSGGIVGREHFVIESKFARPMRLVLSLPVPRTAVESVTVNGKPASYRNDGDSVGRPRVVITDGPAAKWDVSVHWTGGRIVAARVSVAGDNLATAVEAAKRVDPQHALDPATSRPTVAAPGPRTVFFKTSEGGWSWWRAESFDVVPSEAGERREVMPAGRSEAVDLSASFNDVVTRVFKNQYVSPRSPYCSLAIPVQGFGGWATNKTTPNVDDSGLRAAAASGGGQITLPNGVPLSTPSAIGAKNVLFTSQWDNYPREGTVPLSGRSGHAYLLMAGTTNAMQSRLDNGEVIVIYADGGTERLALRNPETWWPIEQDYFVDDYQFRIDAPLPWRIDLKTGRVRMATKSRPGDGKRIDGGAATVLDLPLDPKRELKSLTVRTLANEVVIGLMAVTLERSP